MDVTRGFFGKLRDLALTVEKEVKQLERAMRREDADYEDESPTTVLHDIYCEIKTQKEDVSASLGKSCSEKQTIHEFMKASEILMQRNAADLGKIREVFQKYGYKPHEEVSESAVSVQNKSYGEKANDVPHLSTIAEKPPLPKDPLHNLQLSDFGLSQYAFSRPWSAVKAQHTSNAQNQQKTLVLNSKNETPSKLRTPRALPKTPKCRLKMDDYECVTPKLEHFGISEHTVCMNEDYTMSLIHKTSQTIKKFPLVLWNFIGNRQFNTKLTIWGICPTLDIFLVVWFGIGFFLMPRIEISMYLIICGWTEYLHTTNFSRITEEKIYKKFLLVKRDNNGGNLPEMTVREIMVTPASKSSMRAENADWMASPMVFVFCTPDGKVSSKTNSTVLSRSPETKELPLPSHTATPQCPDFQTRWLKAEAKVVNSNYVHFHMLCHKQFLKWEKIESVTKDDAKDTQYKEDKIPLTASSDEYLKHFEDPSPPKLKHYDQLLNTPPPPEITRIPDDVLKILSQYNHKVDFSNTKEMGTKVEKTTRYESDSTDYCNKENR
ncbi:SKA3 protein, partial [Malurus elegans]|nr:SKA3 protein [Malurus elegans]